MAQGHVATGHGGSGQFCWRGGPIVRTGLIAVAGRPNVGKSTLVNALCGEKVAITSTVPNTTRRRIFGVASGAGWQLVLVDLPGFQRPMDALTERMQATVDASFDDVDAVLLVVDARERIGAGDRFVARRVFGLGKPVIIAVNKIDRLKHGHVASQMKVAATLGDFHALHPVEREDQGRYRRASRRPRLAAPGRPGALPRRAVDRSHGGGARRRGDPREGAAPHAGGGAACPHRRGRGAGRSGRACPHLRRDRVPEGDPDRQARRDDPRDRHARAARGRGARRAIPRSSSSPCACGRSGGATRACSSGSVLYEWPVRRSSPVSPRVGRSPRRRLVVDASARQCAASARRHRLDAVASTTLAMAQAPALCPRGFELPLEPRLPRIGAVDAVALEARAAELAKRSIKRESKLAALELAVRMMDLTTLEGADTPGKVAALCSKAMRPDPADPSIPSVAAVCVYPNLVATAKERLARFDRQGRLGRDGVSRPVSRRSTSSSRMCATPSRSVPTRSTW